MHVQVRDHLPGVVADIGEDSITLRHQPGIASNSAYGANEAGDLFVRRSLRKIVPGDVRALGDDQYMGRRERVDVVEREDMIVLIDLVRRNLAPQDAGED